MKKFNNKKGFTIVELVIVIAVIGILAGVLIPTFSGIVQRANESKINQEMTNALKVVLAGNATSGALANGTTFVMSEKDGTNYKATYYAKYNGNKFEKILNVSGNKDSNDNLVTTGYDRVIVGTNKEGVAYDNTLKAIVSVFGGNAAIVDEKIGSLTVLTNSDLSDGMFVLVPVDDNNSNTAKVNLTITPTECTATPSNGQITKNATLEITFTPNEGKNIDKADITVTIGGSALAQDKFTFESNKLTINDSDVTGDVVITVVAK